MCLSILSELSDLMKMSEIDPCKKGSSSGIAIAGLVIAIVALILVIIIFIFYFLERENFLKVFDPTWTVVTIDKTDKTIAGENYSLYTIPSDFAANDTIVMNKPEGVKPGQWFVITNLSDKAVKIQSGSGVTFSSFPTTSTATIDPPPNTTTANIPGKMSWIITWGDTTGTAINLVPGGIKQN